MKNTLLILVFFLLINNIYSQNNEIIEYLEAKETYENFLDNHSQTLNTENGKIHFLTWGKESDPTLLWLHGSYSNATEIEPFVKELNLNGFRVIAIDYYGHGQTSNSSHILSLENLFSDINFITEHLGIDKIIIGGFSRGAYIATAYYSKHTDKVDALILEDGGVNPFLGHLKGLTPEQLKDFIETDINNRPQELFKEYDTEFEAYKALNEYSDTSRNENYKNFSFIQLKENKYSIYAKLDSIYGMESYESLSKLMKNKLVSNLFANQLMEYDYTYIIRNVQIPTLLLEARSEIDLFDDSLDFEICRLYNNLVHHEVFEKSSHNIHFDQPKDFTITLIKFLNFLRDDHKRITRNR